MLEFEGQTYVTIADLKARFPISEKKLKQLIADGVLPAPPIVEHGTRTFRHYSDEWQKHLEKIVKPRNGAGGSK